MPSPSESPTNFSMSGSDRHGLVLQPRDRRVLEELAVMRVMDREQAKIVAGFGSTTRANVRLLALLRAGLLRRFFLGASAAGRKALYAMSALGAKLIGSPIRGPRRRNGELLVADFFIEHQLTVNEVYCALKFGALPTGVAFRRWVAFFAPLGNTLFIPDGYVELTTPSAVLSAFLEVDLGHESLTVWKHKIRNYLDFALSGRYEREFGQRRFRVLVIANSERRLRSLRELAASMTAKVFWFADLASTRNTGLFGRIWRRSGSGEREHFIASIP